MNHCSVITDKEIIHIEQKLFMRCCISSVKLDILPLSPDVLVPVVYVCWLHFTAQDFAVCARLL